jgi:hypothetical protein
MTICFIFRGEIFRNDRPPLSQEVIQNWYETIFKPLDPNLYKVTFITYESPLLNQVSQILNANEVIIKPKISQLQNMNDVGDYMIKNKTKYSRFVVLRFDILYRIPIVSWNKWNESGIILVSPVVHFYDERFVADWVFIVDSYRVDSFAKALSLCKRQPHEVTIYLTTQFIPFHLMYDNYYPNETHPLYVMNQRGDPVNLSMPYTGKKDEEHFIKCNPIYFNFAKTYGADFQKLPCILKISSKESFYSKLAEINWLKTIFSSLYFESTFQKEIEAIYKGDHFHYEVCNEPGVPIHLNEFSLNYSYTREDFQFEPISYKINDALENFQTHLDTITQTFYTSGRRGILYIKNAPFIKEYHILKDEVCEITLPRIDTLKENRNLFYITCAVKPTTETSAFPTHIRIQQILLSIQSVRKKVPNSFIVLLETGSASDEEKNFLQSQVDHYMTISATTLVKSKGEATLIHGFFTSSWFKENQQRFQTFSKLSGRYFLTDAYDFSKYPIDKVFIKFRWAEKGEGLFETRYYRIPASKINDFITKLNLVVNTHPYIFKHTDIEHAYFLFNFFPLEDTIHDQPIGLAGWYTGDGHYMEE